MNQLSFVEIPRRAECGILPSNHPAANDYHNVRVTYIPTFKVSELFSSTIEFNLLLFFFVQLQECYELFHRMSQDL